MYAFRIRGARVSLKDASPVMGVFLGAAATLFYAPIGVTVFIASLALVSLAIMRWPGQIVKVTPYGLLLRGYKRPGQLTFATSISWQDVQEIFLAPHRTDDAATLVAGRRTPLGLKAVRAELPPGYDHDGLMAALGQAGVPIRHLPLGDVLALTRLPYYVRLSPWWLTALRFILGIAAALIVAANSPAGRFLWIFPVIVFGAGQANVEITQLRLRLGSWQLGPIRWANVTSVRVEATGDVVEMTVATPGRERIRRLPRAAVDPAALEAVVRAYAPEGTVAEVTNDR